MPSIAKLAETPSALTSATVLLLLGVSAGVVEMGPLLAVLGLALAADALMSGAVLVAVLGALPVLPVLELSLLAPPPPPQADKASDRAQLRAKDMADGSWGRVIIGARERLKSNLK